MSEAPSRRFPPVSGPYGWAGAALFLAALVCQLVAVVGLIWAAFNNALGQALPWLIAFVVSFPLISGASWLWRQGWKRSGTNPVSFVTREQRPALLRAGAVILLGSMLGFGGFLYLAFVVQGSRRLAIAVAALLVGSAISEFGIKKMYMALGRPVPTPFFGSSTRWSVVSIGIHLVWAGLVVMFLLWPQIIPMP